MCCVIYLTPMPLLSRTRPDLIKSGAPPCEFHTPTINQNGWWGWLRLFTVTLSTQIWIVSLGQPHTHVGKATRDPPDTNPIEKTCLSFWWLQKFWKTVWLSREYEECFAVTVQNRFRSFYERVGFEKQRSRKRTTCRIQALSIWAWSTLLKLITIKNKLYNGPFQS
jgi:hypothetical protein